MKTKELTKRQLYSARIHKKLVKLTLKYVEHCTSSKSRQDAFLDYAPYTSDALASILAEEMFTDNVSNKDSDLVRNYLKSKTNYYLKQGLI